MRISDARQNYNANYLTTRLKCKYLMHTKIMMQIICRQGYDANIWSPRLWCKYFVTMIMIETIWWWSLKFMLQIFDGQQDSDGSIWCIIDGDQVYNVYILCTFSKSLNLPTFYPWGPQTGDGSHLPRKWNIRLPIREYSWIGRRQCYLMKCLLR